MSSVIQVSIHTSQFPEQVRHDLLDSLRSRQVNHKFHYDSIKQTQQWLALHQAYSPSRNDTDCAAVYDAAFAGACERINSESVHLIGLGCGGGQKDARLLKLLAERARQLAYTPCDVSTAMVLVASDTVLSAWPGAPCSPLVCDLARTDDLPEVFASHGASAAARLITFFGMIPNFAPETILPKLAALVRPGDFLLFSANLAPGSDYAAGVERVLPQYDNPLTREWLLTWLLNLGAERADGEICFTIEADPGGRHPKKIVARFHFHRTRRIEIENESFDFRAGDALQLFFSYRYTPALVRDALAAHGLRVVDSWITKSEEEGVFWVVRNDSAGERP